jgi:murein DD-endopeptidase MepM/ murein hydrolase activator NlpD
MKAHYLATLLCILILGVFAIGTRETEAKVTVSFEPEKVIQGQPLQISVKGKRSGETVVVTFASSSVPMTEYSGKLVGFVPIDIAKKTGMYDVKVVLKDSKNRTNQTLNRQVQVIAREKYEAPLGIPQKLGGNTSAAQKQLVDTLAIENQSLLNLGTQNKAAWKKAFIYPVKNPVVTDPYGYSRLTGAYTITHKGTDFRAPEGTEVIAVNDGEVKLAQLGRNYGNTLVIDHGNGVQSFYMHLSRMDVKVGNKVKRGEVIGLSGKTGYAEAAHLHFTLRINETSIDPEVFLGFFKSK